MKIFYHIILYLELGEFVELLNLLIYFHFIKQGLNEKKHLDKI